MNQTTTTFIQVYIVNYNQAISVFIMTYFGVYFLIGHCLTTVYHDFFSIRDVLIDGWGVRVILASAAVLSFFLWGLA